MICRLCVYDFNKPNMISLFDDNEESEYLKLIAKYMRLQLSQDNHNVSKVICNDCAKNLKDFDVFCKLVEKRQNYLTFHCMTENEVPIDPTKLDEFIAINTMCSIVENDPSNDVKEEDNAIQQLLIKDEEEETADAGLIGFTRSTSVADALEENSDDELNNETINNDYQHLEEGDSKSSDNSEEETPDKVAPEEVKPIKAAKRKKPQCRKVLSKSTKSKVKKKEKSESEDENKDESKSEELSKHEQLIAQHLTVKCELCGRMEPTFLKLQLHFRKEHNTPGYLKCCGKVFMRRYRLYEHLKFHLNPELYKCEICGKNLKSRNCYKKHKQDKHPQLDQLKYICDICGKKHANKHSAQKHREMHNTERISCNLCNKSFKTKYSLEYHVKKMHEQLINPYICDTCGREYKCKLSFNKHVAEHQGIVTKNLQQCDLCEEWVVRLDKHMDRHNHTDVKCEICGKISTSKSGLRSHMEKLHRPCPELPCPFCEKTFKYKKNLKEHIAMHTNTKDYKCKYCEREFRSSANMYAHIKRYHAEQWMEAQLARKKGPTVTTSTVESIVEKME